MEGLSPEINKSAAGPNIKADPTVKAVSEPVPEKFDLHISLGGVPSSLSTLFEKLAEPAGRSWLRDFVKDYLPALTPIATAILTGLIAVYGIKFNNQLLRDTLDKITTEFVEGKGDPTIAAIKLSAYGDKALPAVRIVLAAEDARLRGGGVLIVQQMYLEETVNRKKLVRELFHYYDNPVLRRGVLEWLVKMDRQLSPVDSREALDKLKMSFGSDGQHCAEQDAQDSGQVAQEAANFLSIWHFEDSSDLVLGLVQHCPDNFEGAREQAVSVLPKIASKENRNSILKNLQDMLPEAPAPLANVITDAITEIQTNQKLR